MPSPISALADEYPENTSVLRYMQGQAGPPCLIVIGGATATGKTGLSLQLAKRLPLSILSADSRLVYRGFDIGTAKPTAAERSQAPHYLIDICDPTTTMTVAAYQQQAQGLIRQLHDSRERIPCLVGGTGLYISAVVDGLQIPPVSPQSVLRSQLSQLGQAQCHAMLRQLDPLAGDRIHPNDAVRTIRALEVAYVTGQPLSRQQGKHPPPYPILYIGLDSDSDGLKARIEARTAHMLAQGLVQEVKMLCDRYGADLPLLQTLGYGEVVGYLAGDYSLAEAEQLIVQHTGQFAKRQRTWFRKRPIHWFDAHAATLLDQVWAKVEDFLSRL